MDDIREVTQLSLEMVAKWEVISASSGAEGILRAAAEQPDLILLDVMMPDMDGPTTPTHLCAPTQPTRTSRILLTAKDPGPVPNRRWTCGDHPKPRPHAPARPDSQRSRLGRLTCQR